MSAVAGLKVPSSMATGATKLTGRRPKYGYIVKYQFYLQDGSTIQGNT